MPQLGAFDFASQGQMAYVGKNISVAGFGAKGDFVMGDAHITNLIWRKQPQQRAHTHLT